MRELKILKIRPVLGPLCFFALAWCLVSCAAQPSAKSSIGSLADNRVKLDVCTSSTTSTQIPATYALERGLFAKYGLDVTLTPIDSGSRAVAALISGSVQLCQMSGAAVVNAAVAGADLAIVAGLVNTNVYSLMVSGQIRSAADLKGKAVAVSTAGSSSAIVMRIALKRLGLTPDKDVAILSVGGQSERMAALDAGYVAGTVADPPETLLVRDRGYHALLDMAALKLPFQHTGMVSTRSFIESNRQAVLNYVKAVSEAVFLMKRDREDALAALSKFLQLDRQKDAAILDETYDFLTARFSDIPYPSLIAIQVLLDEITPQNQNAVQVRPEHLVDLGIVQELENKGFFRDLVARK